MAEYRMKGAAKPAVNPNLTPDQFMAQQAKNDPSTMTPDSFMAQQSQQEAASTEVQPSAPYRLVKNYAAALGAPDRFSDIWEGPVYALQHPIDSAEMLGSSMLNAQGSLAIRAKQDWKNKDYLGAMTHGIEYAIPFLGPALAKAGDQLESGDIAGGIGTTLGVGTSVAAPALGPKAAAAQDFLGNTLKTSAQSQYSKFLSPTKAKFKYSTKQVVPELLDRGVVAKSAEGLADTAGENAAPVGEAIGKTIDALPPFRKQPAPVIANQFTEPVERSSPSQPQQVQSIIDHLETYKKGFTVNGVAVDENAVAHANALQDVIQKLGPDVSPQSLNKVRQIWDSSVARAGGYAGRDLAEGAMLDAQREGANAIRGVLAEESPDLAKLNAEFNFWRKVQDIAGATAERQTGQQGPLSRIFAPMAGAVGGFAGFHDLAHATVGAAVMTALTEIARSPLYRTISAIGKARLASAAMAGDVPGMLQAVTAPAAAINVSQVPYRYAAAKGQASN